MVFNRPNKTQQVWDVIKEIKPRKLFVAADAPREGVESDIENCLLVKEIVSQVDWTCDTHYLFHKRNQGCSLAGFLAWKWMFENEERMVFLEDDGLVSLSFFNFCDNLLDRYQNDKRIAYIVGTNHGMTSGNASYFFSRFGGDTYAMATWKRVFDLYEFDLASYDITRKQPSFRRNFINSLAYKLSAQKYLDYITNGGNTYDLQMTYLVHKYNMYNIIPNVNLCTNIGFDLDGANTSVDPDSDMAKQFGNRPRFEITHIVHPERFYIDKKFELRYFRRRVLYDKSWVKICYQIYVQVFVRKYIKIPIKRIFKKIGIDIKKPKFTYK